MTEQTKTAEPVTNGVVPCAECKSTDHSTNGHHNTGSSPANAQQGVRPDTN